MRPYRGPDDAGGYPRNGQFSCRVPIVVDQPISPAPACDPLALQPGHTAILISLPQDAGRRGQRAVAFFRDSRAARHQAIPPAVPASARPVGRDR